MQHPHQLNQKKLISLMWVVVAIVASYCGRVTFCKGHFIGSTHEFCTVHLLENDMVMLDAGDYV